MYNIYIIYIYIYIYWPECLDPGLSAYFGPLEWSDLLVGFSSYGGEGVRCVGG